MKRIANWKLGIGNLLIFLAVLPQAYADEPITSTPKTDEIIVTATRQEKPLKDVPGAVSVISQKSLQSKNILDLADALEDTAGVKILRYGALGSTSTLHIRGLYSQRTLVMVDDRVINSPDTGVADLSNLSIDNVDRIEVVRGPYSALYGPNAVGGAVNIITKKPPETPQANLSTLYGTYQTSITQIESGFSNDERGYLFNSNHKTSQGHRDNSVHRSTNTTIRMNYPNNSSGRASGIFDLGYFEGETGFPGAQPAPDPAKRTQSQLVLGNDNVSSLSGSGYNEKIYLNTTFTLGDIKLRGSFNNWNDDNHREWMEWVSTSYNRITSDSTYRTTSSAMEAIYNRSLSDNQRFSLGTVFELSQYQVGSKQVNTVTAVLTPQEWDARRTTYSAFLQDEITFSNLIVTLGARFDNPTDFDSQLSARGNLLYQLTPSINLRTSYGDSYRAPSLNDLYWPQDEASEGNKNLKPEKGNTTEIGLDYTIKEGVFLKTNIFNTNLKDMIAWAPTGTVGPWGNRWTPTNLNQTSINGLEIEGALELTKDTSFTLSYTLLDATQKSQELTDSVSNTLKARTRRLAYTPFTKLDFTAEQKNIFGIEKLVLDVGVQYVSGTRQYYSDYTAYPAVTTARKSLPGYWLANLKIRKPMRNTEFFIGIDNITDKEYAIQFGSSIDDRDYPMPGRTIITGLTMKF